MQLQRRGVGVEGEREGGLDRCGGGDQRAAGEGWGIGSEILELAGPSPRLGRASTD